MSNVKIGIKSIFATKASMSRFQPVAIIGAGPYGLSIAAHLRAAGVSFRIFGRPMETWRRHMPAGMALKSEGFASRLFEPTKSFTLEYYCKQYGLPYADVGLPVPLATFADYGREFQQRFVPELEQLDVVGLTGHDEGFHLRLEDGSSMEAGRVVVATGISAYGYVPPTLSGFPSELVTHSVDHATVDRFTGRELTVIGAGASALDLAALLVGVGARVRLVARTSKLAFHSPPHRAPGWANRFRAPRSGLGTGWKSLLYSSLPQMFYRLPRRLRHRIVLTHLGPAPCWFTREKVIGKVEMILGSTVEGATADESSLRLNLRGVEGVRTVLTEHVIAATGFRVDLSRLPFLDAELLSQVRCETGSPVLSHDFQSSVHGLYFVGTAAANSFGPLLRFACGAGFTAQRVAGALRQRCDAGKN